MCTFLVCGGNNIELLTKDSDFEHVYRDYDELIHVAREVFPEAKLHVFSLIPRRAKYKAHIIGNMHIMNTWLKDYCASHDIRFIYVFSFFIDKHTWRLNERLFNSSRQYTTFYENW